MVGRPLALAVLMAATAGCAGTGLRGESYAGPPSRSIGAEFVRAVGGRGTGPGQFVSPAAVSVNALGQAFVADTGNDRVQMFSDMGEYLNEIGGFGWGSRQFNAPSGISAATSLDIWVADTQNRRIVHLNSRLNWLGTVDRDVSDGESRELGYPTGVIESEDGWLWLTDRDADRLYRLSPYSDDAEFITTRASVSDLTDPGGLAVGSDGVIIVADTGADRLVFYDQFGNRLTTWGEGILRAPGGVAVTRQGDIVVADTGNDRVLLLNRLRAVVGEVGSRGSMPGAFKEPRGVAVDRRGRLWVADTGNHRVQIFTLNRTIDE